MSWSVQFLDAEVEGEVAALPEDMQAKLFRIIDMIEQFGLVAMREPYVKHLEKSL